jgi:AcrR family transcriptional regulator
MRTTGSNGEQTERALREAGIRLIAQHGFEGMNLRMLAKEIGIKAGSLYNYISNKQSFLYELLCSIMSDMIEGLDNVIDMDRDPADNLTALVDYHIRVHIDHRNEVFIGNMELRSLSEEQRREVIRLRSEYEKRVVRVIEKGMEQKQFHVKNARVAAFALIAMLTGVYNWFRPDGLYSLDEIVEMHVKMAKGLLAAEAP